MRRTLAAAATLALLIGAFGPVQAALAVAPANDDFANAIVIDPSALPFSSIVDNTEATTEAGEPQACSGSPRTVWYAIAPTAAGVLRADMTGSSASTNLAVWLAAGPGLGGLSFVSCASYGGSVTFSVVGGSTYFLQAGDPYAGGGSLHLNLQLMPPPPNDDFADATLISSVPFDEWADASFATTEPGEPTSSCLYYPSPTIWYAFTPSTTATMTALDRNDGYLFPMAAYTGSSLASLVEVACGIGGITFRAEAGTTYYFQVATSWVVEFQLDVAPPPTAGFTYYPGDPSPFDTVQFYDASYDPGGIGIESWSWDFGDGTTSSAQNPTHRFASDGDYTVDLSVATFDDRTGSVSQVVRVATHDVTIAKFTVPNAATSGQTRPISVGISDLRYPENVQVQLFRSNVNGGFDLVGTLAQAVPVRGGNRTTPFGFNYTFTKDDAMLGKVTFRAEATIVDHRDALPADNEAVALPCKVVK